MTSSCLTLLVLPIPRSRHPWVTTTSLSAIQVLERRLSRDR